MDHKKDSFGSLKITRGMYVLDNCVTNDLGARLFPAIINLFIPT